MTKEVIQKKIMSEDQSPTLCYKIILVGDSGVGKTSLANKFVYGRFTSILPETIGAGIFKTSVLVGNTSVDLNIWDTAGHERFKSIIPMYCKDVSLCILVASIDSLESIDNIDKWKELVEQNVSTNFVVAINKMDLKDDGPEPISEMETIQDKMIRKYPQVFFVSAKTGIEVSSLFTFVAQECLKYSEEFHVNEQQSLDTTLRKGNTTKSCC